MKKIVLFFAAALLAGTVLSACKAHEKCPAYGEAEQPAAHKRA